MKPIWKEFDKTRWRRKLPKERKLVLVCVAAKEGGLPPAVAVGYLRFGGGQRDSPFFVIPGVGGEVTHWADCLDDDFSAPCWNFPDRGQY